MGCLTDQCSMLEKQFKQLDADCSGQLDGDELEQLVQYVLSLVKRTDATPAQLEADGRAMLSLMWEETTGRVDYHTFVKIYNAMGNAHLDRNVQMLQQVCVRVVRVWQRVASVYEWCGCGSGLVFE